MNIDVVAHFGCGLLDEHLLATLQAILTTRAPQWASGLRVYDARVKGLTLDLADPLTLYKAVHAEATAPKSAFYRELERRFGETVDQRICDSVELRGAKKSLTIVITVDENRFNVGPAIGRWGNKLTFQILGERVGGVAAEIFARDLYYDLCGQMEPWYARANATEEFSAKNISREGGGVRAIGVNWSQAVPGLYWLNYFAGPSIGVIGTDRFARCAAAKPLGQGFVVALADRAGEWNNAEYQAREAQAKETLGSQFFFDRDHPDRATESNF
jgi:hypothetical protein